MCKLILNILTFNLSNLHILFEVISLLSELLDLAMLFSLVLFRQQLVLLDLLVKVLVVVIKGIYFLGEQVIETEQTIILFFGLDEGCYDFVDIGYATVLFDLVERSLNDLSILNVLVNQPLLLGIRLSELLYSELHDSNWIRESFSLLNPTILLLLAIELLLIELDVLVLLL